MPGAAPAEAATDEAPLHLSFATFEDGLAGESIFKRLFQFKISARSFSPFASTGLRGLLLRSAAIGVVFFAVGYVLSQPLTEASSAAARAGRETWQSIRGWGQHPAEEVQAAAVPAQDAGSDSPQWHGTAGKIKVMPVRNSRSERTQIPFDMPEPIAQRAALQEPAAAPQPMQARAASPRNVNIPDSLGEPFPGVTAAREVAAKVSPALMDALGPVTIPGALSEKLLLQKIDPSYPEKALQAGLRGPVVLQAWIGKDGRIQELKLIRGPLLLGQAAFDAVRNWRYKPYVLNGQAVEAQTLVTVDFNLP
jgi:TonB family protein